MAAASSLSALAVSAADLASTKLRWDNAPSLTRVVILLRLSMASFSLALSAFNIGLRCWITSMRVPTYNRSIR
ncbi:MAG: hypothetical protein ACFBSE_06935, partial [Prochloraceae cyanobacterium]